MHICSEVKKLPFIILFALADLRGSGGHALSGG